MAFDIARLTDPNALAHVSGALLLELVKSKAPQLASRLPTKAADADVHAALNALDADDGVDALMETLHGIHRVCAADDAEEVLEAVQIDVGGETLGNALARAALIASSRFEAAVDLATVRSATQSSTFTLFERQPAERLPQLTSATARAFEAACGEHFNEIGGGSHCRVRQHREGQEMGFLVDHGGARRTERFLNEKDQPETRTKRPVRHDVILATASTGALRILARTEAERLFYAKTLGTVLLNDPKAFVPAERYVLDAIVAPDYAAVLQQLVDADIEAVALREIRATADDDFGTRAHISSQNVLASSAFKNIDMITYASFGIVPRVRKGRRVYRLHVWKGNARKHTTPWVDSAVENFLARLRLVRAPA